MKKLIKSLVLVSMLVAVFALPARVNAQTPTGPITVDDGGKVVFGSAYTLRDGETLAGDLVIFGGSATVEQNAVVDGDIAIFGGSLSISGRVTGSISAMGGSVNLNETSVVEGDVQTMGVVVNQIEGALVKGSVTTENPDNLNLPKINPFSWLQNNASPAIGGAFRSIGAGLWAILQALALGLISLLIALLAPRPTSRVTHAITSAPGVSAGMGVLTFIVAPALILVLAVTIILIPFSLLGIVVIFAATVFAWAAVGQEVGNRLAGLFKVQWAEPVAAGIGAAFLSLLASLLSVILCFNWILVAAVLAFGLGGIVLSRFGTQDYPSVLTPPRQVAVAPVQREPSPVPAVMPVIPGDKPSEPPAQDQKPD